MTANEVPIGSGFLGSVDSDDFKLWKPGKPFPGELIRVYVVVPGASYDSTYLRELLKLHAAHLPKESSSQLCSVFALWVVGVRETRSVKVRLRDWTSRRHQSHLEEVHSLLNQGKILDLTHKLETMCEQEVRYL